MTKRGRIKSDLRVGLYIFEEMDNINDKNIRMHN